MTKIDITEQEWESHVDENGCVYVTDLAGNTICDLYYVTGRIDRVTGKNVLHTFSGAEEYVKYITAIPDMLRELVKAKDELEEAAYIMDAFQHAVSGPKNQSRLEECSLRAEGARKNIATFIAKLKEIKQ